MSTPAAARLWLRKRPGDDNPRRWKWVILHDGKQISTKLSAFQDPNGAEAAIVLAKYIVSNQKKSIEIDHTKLNDLFVIDALDLLEESNTKSEHESVREYRRRSKLEVHIRNLKRLWSGVRIIDVGERTCVEYRNKRTQEYKLIKNPRHEGASNSKVGLPTVRAELQTLKHAIKLYVDRHRLGFMPPIVIPKRQVKMGRWLRHHEIARLLWACRGRVWDEEAGNWRRGKDGKLIWDARLGGWKRDADGRLVIERPVQTKRRALSRLIILGVWTGTRHESLVRARWKRNDYAGYISKDLKVFHRRGDSEIDTPKSRTPVKLTRRLRAHLARWRTRDEALGFTHVIHQPNGQPYLSYLQNFKAVCRDAGIAHSDDLKVHTLRHSCAHWLKSAGVPIWLAADYLAMTTTTLEIIYDHRDHHSQDVVLDLMDKRIRQHPYDRSD